MKTRSALLKLVGIVLAGIMVVSGLPFFCIPSKADTSGDFEYKVLEDGTAEITKFTGSAVVLEIPEEIDGYVVSSLGNYAFFSHEEILSIVIPDSVVMIGNQTFGYCDNLTSINIPASVISIGSNAFTMSSEGNHIALITVDSDNPVYDSRDDCNAIIHSESNELILGCKNTIIPNSVTRIGVSAFAGCTFTEITIPDSVTSIGDSAFVFCENLTSISIPDGVTSIGNYTFSGCSSLTHVDIPDSVTTIGNGAFQQCRQLTAFPKLTNLTSIGEYAFDLCQSLPSISLPNTLTKIGYGTFLGCDSLSDIYYAGSESKWIEINSDLGYLKDVIVHFGETDSDPFPEGNITFNYERSWDNTESETTVYYSNEYFSLDNNYYHHALAKCSLGLAMTSGKKEYAQDFLTNCGFGKLKLSPRWNDPLTDDQDKAAYVFGVKDLNGRKVIAISIRSYHYGNEWGSNGRVGYQQRVYGYHYGFNTAAEDVITDLVQYCNDNNIDLYASKVWVTGFSRAAAVSNCIGAKLEQQGLIKHNNLYCYTFATPKTVTEEMAYKSAQGIYNIINPLDLVPCVPLHSSKAVSFLTRIESFWLEKPWNYTWNGITLELPSNYGVYDYKTQLSEMQAEFQKLTEGEREYHRYNRQLLQALLNILADSTDSEKNYVYGLQDQYIVPALESTMGQGLTDDAAVMMVISQLPGAKVMLRAKGFLSMFDIKAAQSRSGMEDLTLMQQHWLETYLAWLNTNYTPQKTGAIKSIFIQCPVNVEVYDPDGNLVARITDDVVDESMEWSLDAYVDESGTKMIAMPADACYQVVITATDHGTMDYSVKEFDEDGVLQRKVVYEDITIEKDQVFTGEVNEEMNTAAENYNLTTNGSEITYDQDYSSEEINSIAVSVEVVGSGTVMGEGLYTNGDSVVLEAFVKDNSDFEGWYQDGKLISKDTILTFKAETSMNLTAQFTNPTPQQFFNDVQDPTAWYYETVYQIASTYNELGHPLMSGYSNGSGNFGPADPLTRQDFAVILYRLANEPDIDPMDNPFTDTDPSGYYYTCVCWAKANSVISGYNDGRFGVGDKITREQVATILYRFAKDYMHIDTSEALAAGDLGKFNDGTEVSSWAKEALTWATGAGVITGKSQGTEVAARGDAARAEIGAMILRFMTYMDNQGTNK